MAASSSSPQHPTPTPTTTTAVTTTNITTATPVAARPTPNPSSRRLPPPCWSHEETVALIDSYREKWYTLRRGNLKASHWQEVADAVGRRCRFATPSKTSVQCRHKVEKLRKRYRTEKQKALSNPGRFSSSWVYFRKMDAMEKGPSSATAHSNGTDEDDEDGNEEDDENENEVEDDDEDPMPPTNTRSLHRLLNNGVSTSGGSGGGVGGFRLRIPSRPISALPPVTGFRSKGFDRVVDGSPNANSNHNPRYLNGCSSSRSSFGRRTDGGGGGGVGGGGVKRDFDPVSEMVTSIKLLGEGFVKMEQMKIEVAREIERMRMEMEMKRTEMILESQHRIVEAFAKGFSGKKKIKRLQSPDS
ncbi:trihelix transcription factor ASIL2-like [Macadamia integrifolia]|uniref:trihelix transcription factor ASIL2-like n=1 Tax=Macadamia integrifolia TaxID=60698 RepID=UPI001C4FF913|nr:trihelix transcription factor ASIL2-like [Macadamia integrifolia]